MPLISTNIAMGPFDYQVFYASFNYLYLQQKSLFENVANNAETAFDIIFCFILNHACTISL